MSIRSLRTARDHTKGASLRYKLRILGRELQYAWQRAWRGYDSTDVCELGYNFAARMPVLLKEFKKNNFALFTDSESHTTLTEEETNKVLDDMIFYFENCDEDHVCKRLFGSDLCEWDFDKEKSEAVRYELSRCQAEALRLFSKWVWDLWY